MISTNGTRFIKNNQVFKIVGSNYWQAINVAAQNPAKFKRELQFLKSQQINAIRIMAGSEGPDTEPYRMLPSLQPSPGVYNQEILKGLDIVLDECRKLDIVVIMVLSNFWHWSGGFAQYLAWSRGTSIKYPTRDPATWPEFEQNTAKFYGDAKCNQMYRDHIKFIMTRVNSVNNLPYAKDTTIFGWEIANEPRESRFEWIDSTCAFIKSHSPHQLVTVGVEGVEQDRDIFLNQHQSKHVDFTTGHCWVEV